MRLFVGTGDSENVADTAIDPEDNRLAWDVTSCGSFRDAVAGSLRRLAGELEIGPCPTRTMVDC